LGGGKETSKGKNGKKKKRRREEGNICLFTNGGAMVKR
jgi:hypothetical protein